MSGRSFFTHNVNDGALEAIVHGMRDGMLRQEDYHTICQCETLDDVKLHLASTDYGAFLQNESVLQPRIMFEAAQERLVKDFDEIRRGADQPLAQFLDFVSYEFMISNVLKLIAGSKSGNTMDLLTKCHPLGVFPGIGALTSATSMDDMFEMVLVDSPIGRFFQRTNQKDFDELSIEYLRNILHKNWLEQFYDFCEALGGPTAELMCDLLAFEADRSVITVTLNTCSRKASLPPDDRRKLYPTIGKLVDIHDTLCSVETEEELKEKLKLYPEYYELFDESKALGEDPRGGAGGARSLEKTFRDRSIAMHKWSFMQQFHLGIFYSYIKLKELEVDNIMWIAECIAQGMRHRIHEFAVIF
jgi:V-type H+-transporting ATPase subunit d